MKLSEYIKKLQEIFEKEWNIDCVYTIFPEFSDPEYVKLSESPAVIYVKEEDYNSWNYMISRDGDRDKENTPSIYRTDKKVALIH